MNEGDTCGGETKLRELRGDETRGQLLLLGYRWRDENRVQSISLMHFRDQTEFIIKICNAIVAQSPTLLMLTS